MHFNTRLFMAVTTLLLAVLSLFSCSKNPDREIDEAIAGYAAGDSGSKTRLEGLILKASAKQEFSGEVESDGEMIWKSGGGDVKVVWPREATFTLMSENMNTMRCADAERVAFSDGLQIFIFDWKGNMLKYFTAGDEKKRVMALALSEGTIYYFRQNSVWSSGVDSPEKAAALEGSFSAPYSKFYNAALFARGNRLGLLLGVAGSYNLNIMDMRTGRTVISNIRLAASRFCMTGDRLTYISGSTGSWSLNGMSLETKKKDVYRVFRDLADVEMVPGMVMVEDGRGLWMSPPENTPRSVCFAFSLSGRGGTLALINYSDRAYLVDAGRLYELIVRAQEAVPSLSAQWKG
jgi:hypothetical protein